VKSITVHASEHSIALCLLLCGEHNECVVYYFVNLFMNKAVVLAFIVNTVTTQAAVVVAPKLDK